MKKKKSVQLHTIGSRFFFPSFPSSLHTDA